MPMQEKTNGASLSLCMYLCPSKTKAQLLSLDVNFCKDHRDKIKVPDPLAVEDLISSKLKNKRKLHVTRLTTQCRDIPILCNQPCQFQLLSSAILFYHITKV